MAKRPFDTHIIVLHVQMNEFPEGHVKSAFLGIVHFAHCCTFLNGHSFLKTLHIIFYTLAGNSLLHQLSCVQNKKDRGTVTEIYYRYSISDMAGT